jgi:hypothetical protein
MDIVGRSVGNSQSGRVPAPRWCPRGLTKTQRHCLQKMRQIKIAEKRMDDQKDAWFNQPCPMVAPKKTWQEKHLATEECHEDSSDSGQDQEDDGQPKEEVMGETEGQQEARAFEVNMVFMIPTKFRAPEVEVTEMVLGAEHVVFEKLGKIGKHVKPLYMKGHLDGKPLGRMMVDGGASINIMPWSTFQKLGHQEHNLK